MNDTNQISLFESVYIAIQNSLTLQVYKIKKDYENVLYTEKKPVAVTKIPIHAGGVLPQPESC